MQFFTPKADQNITAVACSILNFYNIASPNAGYPPLDAILKKAPRNVVLFLLDGLGQNILTGHLSESSFLRLHQMDTLSSVFPPTTTAAATALETGLFPSQSGWLGWSIFWPPLGQNIALYPNTTENGQQAAAYHIGEHCLSVTQLTKQIRKARGIDAVSISSQGDINASSPEDVFAAVNQLCNSPGEHFIYAYLNDPDHHLHHHGCNAKCVKELLVTIDKALENLQKSCPDTIFILTADHGFIDVESLCLEDFPKLEDTLIRKPSIEPRVLNLFVKHGHEQQFLKQWKEAMGDSYILYTKAQVLEQQLFGPGPYHHLLEDMLGDYLAVACTPLTLFPNPSYLKFMKATHGGMTSDELTVPLIVWNSLE